MTPLWSLTVRSLRPSVVSDWNAVILIQVQYSSLQYILFYKPGPALSNEPTLLIDLVASFEPNQNSDHPIRTSVTRDFIIIDEFLRRSNQLLPQKI